MLETKTDVAFCEIKLDAKLFFILKSSIRKLFAFISFKQSKFTYIHFEEAQSSQSKLQTLFYLLNSTSLLTL